MARKATRSIAATLAIAAGLMLASGVTPTADARTEDEKLTFTVGVSQEIDSLNLTNGYLVVDYEVWNLQYATLTDKSDNDFSIKPGLAETWESTADGLTWTYHLREGLLWSDGEPLTAEDVAYTINRSVEEEWFNHTSITGNLTATALDATTVEIVTSAPDPRLPMMDAYILPKHVYENIDTEALTTYAAEDGVGSGPFTLTEHEPGQYWKLARNENWYGEAPAVDEVVFRYFAEADALVTSLERGEVDAIDSVPGEQVETLAANENIEIVQGNQGGFNELAMNAGDGLGDGHAALKDAVVRQAVNWAIDREVLVADVLDGYGTPGAGLVTSASPAWDLIVPEDETYSYNPDRANDMLDGAGYADVDGDGIREMPEGTNPLKFRLNIRSDSENDKAVAEFVVPWLKAIGIEVNVKAVDSDQLTTIIGLGEYEMFTWGWVPFVDPDPELSYFTCGQITMDPDSPGYNDGNWCNAEYDALYEQQHVELDADRRMELVQEMLMVFYTEAPYAVLWKTDDIMAYRSDRWEGFVRQPADTGPILFTNSSHSYQNIVPAGTSEPTETTEADTAGNGETDDEGNLLVTVGAAVLVLLIIGGIIFLKFNKGQADRE